MTKRKEQRRELLKEDEILSRMERAARYIQQNPVQVLVGFLAVLGLIAIYSAWQGFSQKEANDQAAMIYEVEKIFDADLERVTEAPEYDSEKARYEAALSQVDKALAEVEGVFRHQALTYKIQCLIALGRQDELPPIYEELADSGKGPTKLIGIMGLGDLALADDDFDTAMSHYDRLEREGGEGYSELVAYKRAICLEGKGEPGRARDEVNRIVEKYEGDTTNDRPPIFTKAKELLDSLEGDDEAEGGTES